jgi:hypothetical protein
MLLIENTLEYIIVLKKVIEKKVGHVGQVFR